MRTGGRGCRDATRSCIRSPLAVYVLQAYVYINCTPSVRRRGRGRGRPRRPRSTSAFFRSLLVRPKFFFFCYNHLATEKKGKIINTSGLAGPRQNTIPSSPRRTHDCFFFFKLISHTRVRGRFLSTRRRPIRGGGGVGWRAVVTVCAMMQGKTNVHIYHVPALHKNESPKHIAS